jgi:hypothetical protein
MNNKILKKLLEYLVIKLLKKILLRIRIFYLKKSNLTVEKILFHLFKRKYIKYIVQISANDGVSYEHINYFIKKYKIKSLLAEPTKNNLNFLLKIIKN